MQTLQKTESPFQNWEQYCQSQDQDRDFYLNKVGIDLGYIHPENETLNPQLRALILHHVIYKLGWELPDVPLLHAIFGQGLVEQWSQKSQKLYPHFKLIVAVKLGEEELEISCHHQPIKNAPKIDEDCDYSWDPLWDSLEVSLSLSPDNTLNDLELEWSMYPDEQSFSTTGELMSASELVESFEAAKEAILLAGYRLEQFRLLLVQ